MNYCNISRLGGNKLLSSEATMLKILPSRGLETFQHQNGMVLVQSHTRVKNNNFKVYPRRLINYVTYHIRGELDILIPIPWVAWVET